MGSSPDAAGHLPLRPVELEILLSLSKGELHGYGIILDAESRGGGRARLDVATMYRALKRMENQGLVTEAGHRTAPDGEERRRYYAITRLGEQVARAEALRLAELVRAARGADLLKGVEPA